MHPDEPASPEPMGDNVARADRWGVLALLAVVAVGLGALGANLLDDGVQEPRVVRGIAMPNAAGGAISLHAEEDGGPDASGEGFVIAGASWAGPDDVWHDGTQTSCVGTDTSVGTRVELGLVDYSDPIVGTGTQVVWLRCLE